MANEPTILTTPPAPQGAPAGGATTQPNPQAQGGAPQGVTLEQLKSLLDDHGTKVHNAIFAEIRKAGVFEGKEPKDSKDSKPGAPSALTADDVSQMMARRDTLHGAIASVKIPEGARQRMLGDFARENPADVGGWAKKYCEDYGFMSSAATPPAPASPTGPPMSNLGSPAGPTTITEDTPLWRMSESDRAQLLKQKGHTWFRQKYYADLRQTRVKVRNY